MGCAAERGRRCACRRGFFCENCAKTTGEKCFGCDGKQLTCSACLRGFCEACNEFVLRSCPENTACKCGKEFVCGKCDVDSVASCGCGCGIIVCDGCSKQDCVGCNSGDILDEHGKFAECACGLSRDVFLCEPCSHDLKAVKNAIELKELEFCACGCGKHMCDACATRTCDYCGDEAYGEHGGESISGASWVCRNCSDELL